MIVLLPTDKDKSSQEITMEVAHIQEVKPLDKNIKGTRFSFKGGQNLKAYCSITVSFH